MSRKPVFAMTADWHGQDGAWKRANTPKGDALFGLSQIVDYCLLQKVDLLGAGDLFDDLKPETIVLKAVFAQCDRLSRAERKFLFTQGQHEKAQPPYLSLVPGPIHASGRQIDLRGLTVYGMDHVPADQLEAAAAKIPTGRAEIVMCHQVWADFMGVGAEGHIGVLGKAGGPGIVLTGDYHKHLVTQVDGLRVYSPGSTCLQSIDEPREKAFFVLYDDLSVESVPLKTRSVFDHVVKSGDDLEALLAAVPGLLEPRADLPAEMQKPVLYVQCVELDQAFRRVAGAVKDRAFLFWKPLLGDANDVFYDEREAALAVPRGLEGCLPLVAPAGGPVHATVLRLLRAPDKKQELAALVAEFGRTP